MSSLEESVHGDGQEKGGGHQGLAEGDGQLAFNGGRISVLQDGKVLQISHLPVSILLTPLNQTPKNSR